MSFYMFEQNHKGGSKTEEIRWLEGDLNKIGLKYEWDYWLSERQYSEGTGTAYKLEYLTLVQREELIQKYKNQIKRANLMLLNVEEYAYSGDE